MNNQDEEAARKLRLLGERLRLGLERRAGAARKLEQLGSRLRLGLRKRAGIAYDDANKTLQPVHEAIQKQFPEHMEMLTKEMRQEAEREVKKQMESESAPTDKPEHARKPKRS